MSVMILVVDAEKATDLQVVGGRLIDLPFEADASALAVVRALSELDGDGFQRPSHPPAIAATASRSRAG